MAYSQNVKEAARRHFRAAEVLYNQNLPQDRPPCAAVAGYLFGTAGELAVKELMRDSGMKPSSGVDRREDPFYAHFPELKKMLAGAHGRRSGELRKISEDLRLFANWDTAMRYAPNRDIPLDQVQGWMLSAKELMARMEAV